MESGEKHSWDFLSEREAHFTEWVMRELAGAAWAQPLFAEIERNGGITRANKARFFELRLGYALETAGAALRYEVPGEGESSLDFGFSFGGCEWLVELMRLEETKAVKDATYAEADADGIPWFGLSLSTNADNPAQSPEGETIKAVQRICQKFERDGRPHKFPVPGAGLHILLVDFRTFLNGGDPQDRIHVGLGGEYAAGPCRLFWKGELISGVFSERTAVRGAAEARQRLHFLGFVHEKDFEPGAFGGAVQFIANPSLFRSADEVHKALSNWPLQPTNVLNA